MLFKLPDALVELLENVEADDAAFDEPVLLENFPLAEAGVDEPEPDIILEVNALEVDGLELEALPVDPSRADALEMISLELDPPLTPIDIPVDVPVKPVSETMELDENVVGLLLKLPPFGIVTIVPGPDVLEGTGALKLPEARVLGMVLELDEDGRLLEETPEENTDAPFEEDAPLFDDEDEVPVREVEALLDPDDKVMLEEPEPVDLDKKVNDDEV